MSLVNAQSDTSNHLDKKQESIISIAALTGKGELKKLPKALNEGLDNGLTVNQIKEILIQVYAYAGFPRSLQGIQAFMKVVDERKAKGVNDIEGNSASPIVSDSTKYERGKAILEKLTGVQESGAKKGYAAFTPTIEVFLYEYRQCGTDVTLAFGHLFTSWHDRKSTRRFYQNYSFYYWKIRSRKC